MNNEWTVRKDQFHYAIMEGDKAIDRVTYEHTARAICDSHNAALGAVCKVSQDSQKALWEATKQLADEREVSNKISENARNLHIDNQQLRSQLAAANDRFDTLQRQAEELHGRAQRAEKQLAAALDALNRLAMRVLQSDFYMQAKEETDNALLLTKVKEGK